MPLALRFKSTLLEKRIRYGHNNQINSHGFTLTYAAMLVIRNILKPIHYLHKSHRHCFLFPLGHLHVPGELANNDYAKLLGGGEGVKEVYHGIVQVVNTEMYNNVKKELNSVSADKGQNTTLKRP